MYNILLMNKNKKIRTKIRNKGVVHLTNYKTVKSKFNKIRIAIKIN